MKNHKQQGTKIETCGTPDNNGFSSDNSFFFLSGFSFPNIHDSQDSRRRGGYLFTSSLPLPPVSQTLRH